MIGIIDCGSGNVKSVENAFRKLGAEARVISGPEKIGEAEKIVFPGVGNYGYTLGQLRARNMEAPLKKALRVGKPFLGICLGLQALFSESEESPGVKGLGIFSGKVARFKEGKVPQIGWNYVKPVKNGLVEEGFAYFVNSYYAIPENEEIVAAKTKYFTEFACAVQSGNITAVQFHPEKSGAYGLKFLKRWLEC